MLETIPTSHPHPQHPIPSFHEHPPRCKHHCNRLLNQVTDTCNPCHRTFDCHPFNQLHLVAALIQPWLSSNDKRNSSREQSSRVATVPQDSLIRSGLRSPIFSETIDDRILSWLCMLSGGNALCDITTQYDAHAR
jgi:hypothetical protein